ncbi:hypothetical protein [Burkholderia ambifaria]|uniref:hypothetical protein n=1 Tax=Burkholderia ambifaria TaxID=152480 RepID=UPI001590DCB3|nr:hypothetical protein [Burkholderia ambifaria]
MILIDRRGEAWIALLECDVPAASGAPWTHGSDHGNGASGGGLAQADRTLPLQWLTLRGRHYLATWQREPFDDDTLRRFASALHAHRAR